MSRPNPPMLGVPILTGEIETELAVMEMLAFVMRHAQTSLEIKLTDQQQARIAEWFARRYGAEPSKTDLYNHFIKMGSPTNADWVGIHKVPDA